MRVVKRLAVILTAYLCAAIVAVVPILMAALLPSNATIAPVGSEVGFIIVFLVSIAAVYALPVAVPAIVFVEVRKSGRWQIFAAAGLLLGILMTAALTDIPYRGIDTEQAAIMIFASLLGSMTYWLVGWKLLSPSYSAAAATE